MLFESIFISLFTLTLSDVHFLLLHTNNMNSQFRPVNDFIGYCDNDTSTSCYGGFARLKFATDYKRQEAALKGRQTLYFNAGNTYEGTPYFTFYEWKIVSEMVSMLGLDVMVST